MMSVVTQSKKKKNLFYWHIAITAVIIFGFGFLPPIEPITPLGMRVVGIFIGAVYGWTTVNMLWPSVFLEHFVPAFEAIRL